MKIIIIGPGAMGCLFAAHLAKTKEDVCIFDKNKERADIISRQGLIVEGISGSWQVKPKITCLIKELDKPEIIIICVKSYDTKEAINQLKPVISDNTKVLTLQNGIGNIEILSEAIGSEKVIGGSTNQGATLIKYGHIRHAGRGETIIGCIDGRAPVELRSIREAFNKAGLTTKVSRDIKGLLWSKLIINTGINSLTAITRLFKTKH